MLQAYINNILRQYLDKFILVYIDNILVYFRTLEEHVKHVRTVLYALKDYNLRLKPGKCEFYKERIKFIRYFISVARLKIDLEVIIGKVKEWPIPTNVKGL
jgi:hypothetical protein